jgi:hypothetical protein
MSGQVDIISEQGSTYLGIESAFGAGAGVSLERAVPLGGSVKPGFKRDQLAVRDERTRGFAHIKNIQGLKSTDATLELEFAAKAALTQLLGPSAVADTTGQYLMSLILGLWGNSIGENFWIAQGSTVVSATSSSVTVTAGHGATRFKKGQWIAVQIGAAQTQPVRITNIVTDTLSVWPNFTSTPTAGYLVGNGVTIAPSQTHSYSLEIAHAKSVGISGLSDAQWQARGVTGDLKVDWKRGELMKFSASLKAATYERGVLGLSTAYAGETMSAAQVPLVSVITLLQPFTTTTSVNYPLVEAGVEFAGGMMQVKNHGANTPGTNGVETVTGVLRVPVRPFATATVKHRFDPAAWTEFDAQTSVCLVQLAQIGTGLTARYVGWELPNAYQSAEPQMISEEGVERMVRTYESLEDANVTSASTDLGFGPARLIFL